ncbi:MAG: hypothetical protein FWD39_00465 [Clostridiales bacterium]|nr:hypothetical protein [Clostridiales bacterium]
MRGGNFFTQNKLLKTCMSFGLLLGLRIYLIGILLGGWLDGLLGSAPWCLLAGVLSAIFFSFYQLIRDFAAEAGKDEEPGAVYKNYDDYDKKDKKDGGDKWEDWDKWDDREE